MAPKLFRRKKRVNLKWEPPASGSHVCMSHEHEGPSISTSSSRRIDRSTSQLIDSRRVKITHEVSSTSKPKTDMEGAEGLFNPESSSCGLLGNDSAFIDVFLDQLGPVAAPAVSTVELSRLQAREAGASSTSVLIPASPEKQAVVLRVSLHCKACEGKVKKHISKMEGVTSFSVDLMTKKVTVVGDVTPLGVLNSISKVKNAQFWPSSPRRRSSIGLPGPF